MSTPGHDIRVRHVDAGGAAPGGPFKVAAVQMASGPVVAANLAEAARLAERGAEAGARLVLLPENFAIMGMHEGDKVALREHTGNGPIQHFLSALARRLGVWLAAGSVPMMATVPDKIRQSLLLYDDEGRLAARYDKIHLFGFSQGAERYHEALTIEPGADVVTVGTPLGRIGLSVCYDLRFPELYRAMGNVDLILMPAAFTATTGRAHWETLVRARAIENQAYVIAAAQGGYHVNGRETHGDTMVVDPWGVVLGRHARGPGVVVAGVQPDFMRTVRQNLPALNHRTVKFC